MSYTMTLDMPGKASAYVERRGAHFQSQLRSLVIAFVTTEMQREGYEWSGDYSDATQEEIGMSENVVDAISGVVKLPDGFDDKNIRAQSALEKYEGVS